MARFLVQLRGENYLLNLDGEHSKVGFNAKRAVKAQSREEAERIAIIQAHQQLNQTEQVVKNIPDSPKITIVSTENIGLINFIRMKRNRDFEFFSEIDHPADEK
jgi:hypothetical protein